MSNDINEIIKRKEKLIDLLNKLMAAVNSEKDPNEIKKLDSIITRIFEELGWL